MTDLLQKWIQMQRDGILPITGLSGTLNTSQVKQMSKRDAMHDRNNSGVFAYQVHIRKGSCQLLSVLLREVELKSNGGPHHVPGSKDLRFDFINASWRPPLSKTVAIPWDLDEAWQCKKPEEIQNKSHVSNSNLSYVRTLKHEQQFFFIKD